MDFDIERIPVNVDPGIKELSIKLTAAEKEIERLREQREQIQENYNRQVNQTYHNGCLIENQKKVIEDLNKTLALYEKENKAMRALLQLWI